MRAVLDTNIFISGLFDTRSAPASVMDAWRDGRFGLVISPPIIAEIRDVLTRSRLRKRLRWNDTLTERLIAEIDDLGELVDPPPSLHIVRDEDDNRILEAAIAGDADYIVSGDRDLLALGSYGSIQIVTPAAFVAILGR